MGMAGFVKRHRLLLAATVIATGLLFFVVSEIQHRRIYSVPISTLQRDSGYADKTLRTKGILKPGSLTQHGNPCRTVFMLTHEGAELTVHYAHCALPDTFRDRPGIDDEAIVEGSLRPNGAFDAAAIMVKVGGPYEMKQRTR